MTNHEQIIELQNELITNLITEVTNVQNSLLGINEKIREFNEKRFEVIDIEVELPEELPLPVNDDSEPTVPITLEEIAQINIDFPQIQLVVVDDEYLNLIYRNVRNQVSRSESKETIIRLINNL